MAKTVLVIGASGVVGQGVVKVSLEKGYKVVGVFRSSKSAEKTSAHLGNPSQDKFISVIGNLSSEESAAELQKAVLTKAGEITDVVASIGTYDVRGPLLEMKAEELDSWLGKENIVSHFLAAKYFLPILHGDKDETSYTIINGALGVYVPNWSGMSHVAFRNGALNKFSTVLFHENKDSSTRINEWDDTRPDSEVFYIPTPYSVTNIELGKAIVGIITHPNSRGKSLNASGDALKQLTETGKDN